LCPAKRSDLITPQKRSGSLVRGSFAGEPTLPICHSHAVWYVRYLSEDDVGGALPLHPRHASMCEPMCGPNSRPSAASQDGAISCLPLIQAAIVDRGLPENPT
jgi:hypothetical protein